MILSEIPENFQLTLDHFDEARSKSFYGPDGRSQEGMVYTPWRGSGVATWHAYITRAVICSHGEAHRREPFCKGHGSTPVEAMQQSLDALESWLMLEKAHKEGI